MATKICYKWNCPGNKADVLWIEANWLWKDCQLIEEIISFPTDGVDPTNFFPKWIEEPTTVLDKEKRRRLVKLICKVKGETLTEEKLMRDDIAVTVEDVIVVVKKVANVDLVITAAEE
jgi:hypothetical protein